jgi:hypothetical protein
MRDRAELALPVELGPPTPWPDAEDTRLLTAGLRAWARAPSSTHDLDRLGLDHGGAVTFDRRQHPRTNRRRPSVPASSRPPRRQAVPFRVADQVREHLQFEQAATASGRSVTLLRAGGGLRCRG